MNHDYIDALSFRPQNILLARGMSCELCFKVKLNQSKMRRPMMNQTAPFCLQVFKKLCIGVAHEHKKRTKRNLDKQN